MGKLWTATVAGVLVFVVTSFVFYALLMVDQFAVWEAAVARPEPILWSGLLGMVLLIFTMSYMYPLGYKGGDPLAEGARFGLMVGAILTAAILIHYSVYQLELAGIIADIVFNVALLAVVGAVIGKIYGDGGAPSGA